MSDLFKQILSLLLISSILMGVIGINLYHHICECTGNHYISLTKHDNPCHQSEQSCCNNEHESSCSNESSQNEKKPSLKSESCCHDFTQLIKLKIKFTTDTAKKIVKRALFVYVYLFNFDENDSQNNAKPCIISKQFQIIKVPIQKLISYIHISARSAYVS